MILVRVSLTGLTQLEKNLAGEAWQSAHLRQRLQLHLAAQSILRRCEGINGTLYRIDGICRISLQRQESGMARLPRSFLVLDFTREPDNFRPQISDLAIESVYFCLKRANLSSQHGDLLS